MNIAEEIIMHYSSQFYDASKAHDYYIKTRELKGRSSSSKSTKGFSKGQKEAWTYAKSEISTKKKDDQTVARTADSKQTAQLRARAAASQKLITAKLQAWADKLATDTKYDRASVSDDLKSKLASIPKLSKDASPAEREAHQRDVEKIRNDASSKREKIGTSVSSTRDAKSVSTKAERDVVRGKLKTVIAEARTNYKKAMGALDSKYEQTSQKEHDNIQKNVR